MKHEIRLYGPIGGMFGYTAEEILSQIPEDAQEATVRIHSPGGIVGEGIAIYHALKDHSANITTIIDGDAHSIASIVFLSGDTRRTFKPSRMLVHDPWAGPIIGNSRELRQVADRLDETGEAIVDIYETETGLSRDALFDLMEESRYMRGEEMKSKGFATELTLNEKAEVAIAAMLNESDMVAAQTKEQGVMSKQLTRKEIEAKLAEVSAAHETAVAEIAALKESAPLELEAKNAEHEAAILAKDEEISAAKTEAAEAAAKVEEISAKVDELTAAAEVAAEELATVKAEAETQGAELAKAQAALKNPAVADAVMGEAQEAAQTQIDAEADAAEKAAQEAEEANDEPKNILAEYEAMDAGPERVKFWNENKRAILACEPEEQEDK